MYKPALKIWIPLGVVAIAGLISPTLYGSGAENRLRESMLSLDRALRPWLRASVKSYQRGWLGSRAEIELAALTGDERRTYTVPLQIFHGPFALSGIVSGQAPLRPLKAAFSAAIDPRELLGIPSSKNAKQLAEQFRARGVSELGGDTLLSLLFPVIPGGQGALSSEGGAIELDLAEGLARLNAAIDLPGLTLVTDGGRRALSLGELQGSVRAEQGLTELQAELDLESLALAGRKARVGLRNLRAGRTLKRGEHRLLLGRGSLSAESAAVRVPGPGWNWKFRGLNLGDSASVKEGQLIYQCRLRVKQWQTDQQSFGPVDATLMLARLDAAELSKAAARLNRLRASYDPSDPAGRERFADRAREALVELARGRPRLELTFKLSQGEQWAWADLRMAVDPERVTTAASLKRLNHVTRWVATLRAPAAMLEQVLRRGVDSYARVATHLDLGADEKKEKMYRNLVDGILQNELLTRDEEGYKGRLEWTGKRTLLNGKPINPWTLIKLVAIAKALQGPLAKGPIKLGPVPGNSP